MEGCKYCNFEPNGDIPDDRKLLFDFDICKTLDITASASIYYGNVLEMSIYSGGQDSIDKRIRIKYCPMCGRKLTKIKYD